MIAWISGKIWDWGYMKRSQAYKIIDAGITRENDLEMINSDLKAELIAACTHRDELQARYGDQEAERIASTGKAAKRSEWARKASQARWGKKVA